MRPPTFLLPTTAPEDWQFSMSAETSASPASAPTKTPPVTVALATVRLRTAPPLT